MALHNLSLASDSIKAFLAACIVVKFFNTISECVAVFKAGNLSIMVNRKFGFLPKTS